MYFFVILVYYKFCFLVEIKIIDFICLGLESCIIKICILMVIELSDIYNV